MVDPEIVREWKAKGDEDFAFALVNLQEDKPFYAQICFHFHQAADLNVFYVETRYPVHWPTQFTRMEAERACEAADRVKRWLELQIPIHPEP